MTLAVESNTSKNGGDLIVTRPPQAQGHPLEPTFSHIGELVKKLTRLCPLKRSRTGDPLGPCISQQHSPWVAVSGPGFMMEGKEGGT